MKDRNELNELMEESVVITSPPTERITSLHAKKWYDTGFEFAVNYIYAELEYYDLGSAQVEFKNFCARHLPDVIDKKYMRTYNFDKDPEIITSPQARNWYDFGYKFAVNYIYAKLAGLRLPKLTQDNFKAFCDNRLGTIIDLNYFGKSPFYDDEKPGGGYPSGQCPGEVPNTCIPCFNDLIRGFPRP